MSNPKQVAKFEGKFKMGCLVVLMVVVMSWGALAQRSLVYFYSPSCGSCLQTTEMLEIWKAYYPDLQVVELNIMDTQGQPLLEEYGQRYGVAANRRGLVPAIFYGADQAFVGLGEIRGQLERALQTPNLTPAPDTIARSGQEAEIIQRFQTFSAGTVLVAGLIDGINPCAFSTLIFFISFIIVSGQRGRKILYVGASFTLGIFLSYLVMGWGIFNLMSKFQSVNRLARWIYPVTALLVTGLAVVSLYDYWKVRGRKSSQMVLTLPKGIVKLINRVVHRLMKLKYLIPVSFITGVLVSFLEFLCTGQIYLPTIVYIAGVEHLRARSLLYLSLYNLSFILPMVVIFVVAYKTNTSRQVSEFLHARLEGVKLLMTVLFVILALYLWGLTRALF